MRKIIPYNPRLLPLAKKLRKDMTLSEVLLWNEIKNKRLGVRFSRQIPIDEFIVDFYCKDLQLAIEIDGESHFYDDQPEKDSIRQKRLESLGVQFVRFDDLDVKKNINWVITELMHAISEIEPTSAKEENPPLAPPRRGIESASERREIPNDEDTLK
jgi:very-short-patch-repair endonuclease